MLGTLTGGGRCWVQSREGKVTFDYANPLEVILMYTILMYSLQVRQKKTIKKGLLKVSVWLSTLSTIVTIDNTKQMFLGQEWNSTTESFIIVFLSFVVMLIPIRNHKAFKMWGKVISKGEKLVIPSFQHLLFMG